MKKYLIFRSFLLLIVIFGCTNVYSQVFRFYTGEEKPASEVAVITILKDKKAPIFLFSINDSIGKHYKAEKYFFNNLGDYACGQSVLPGKYKLCLGSKTTDRRYVTFEALAGQIYIVKEGNSTFVVYDKKKKAVQIETKIIEQYNRDSIDKTQPSPAYLNDGHKIMLDVDDPSSNYDTKLLVYIVSIDGKIGNNYKRTEIWEGADQTILSIQIAGELTGYMLPIVPGVHTIEYFAVASKTTMLGGKMDVKLHNSPKPQKITFNFESGKKYQLVGEAKFGSIYSNFDPLITNIHFEEYNKNKPTWKE